MLVPCYCSKSQRLLARATSCCWPVLRSHRYEPGGQLGPPAHTALSACPGHPPPHAQGSFPTRRSLGLLAQAALTEPRPSPRRAQAKGLSPARPTGGPISHSWADPPQEADPGSRGRPEGSGARPSRWAARAAARAGPASDARRAA